MQRAQVGGREPTDRLTGAEDGVAVGVIRPQPLAEQLEDLVIGACPRRWRSPPAPRCVRGRGPPPATAAVGPRSVRTSSARGEVPHRERGPDNWCGRGWCRHRALRREPRVPGPSWRAVRRSVPLKTMCSSRCETPILIRGSWALAVRTQTPAATERTPGRSSVRMVRPLGATVRKRL